MRKESQRLCFLFFTIALMIISIALSACGGEVIQVNQGTVITQKVRNIDTVSITPTPAVKKVQMAATPDAQPTATPTATSTPTPVATVSWNTSASMIYTIGYANVRSAPYTSGALLRTIAPSQQLAAYGTVNGEILADGALWYRISDANSAPQYVYNDLVTTNKPVPVNNGTGKVIKVNLTLQHAYAYDNGQLVHDNLITSGQPNLLTPTGTFQIISKLHPTTFYSPWPKGSPYYYAPLQINYALGFQGTLLFLHDAYWRGTDFGPGTNVPHTSTNGTQMTGSHGCVEMSTADAAWYYNWAPIGTPLIISY